MTYRTKVRFVEAWFFAKNSMFPKWLGNAITSDNPTVLSGNHGGLTVISGELTYTAAPGDWIVLYPTGALGVFTDKDFRDTYEKIDTEGTYV